MDLFSRNFAPHKPLAARLRPQALEDYVGQEHLLAEDRPLRRAAEQGGLYSMVLWGPPGVGKTTLAHLLAEKAGLPVQSISAVTAGVRDIRQLVDQAQQLRLTSGKGLLVFIDEIHRFNKAVKHYINQRLIEYVVQLFVLPHCSMGVKHG